jgi:uncharacterized membrane protein
MDIVIVKWIHVLSSTLLFGTGIGSAFYLLAATLHRDTRVVAAVASFVVRADYLFTATTAIIQPVSGAWLMVRYGMTTDATWLRWSIGLYIVAIGCWVPVVWLQIRLRDLARDAVRQDLPLPPQYWRYFRIWVALGVPAFVTFLAIFYLMVAKIP